MTTEKNIVWSSSLVRRGQREILLKQRGCVIWFTGLSGSGKSTVARALELRLVNDGRFAYVLDGDNIRHGLNKDLGFSPESRVENIRRIGEVAHLFADAGAIAVAAFISPYRRERDQAREISGDSPFVEVYISANLDACESRDPKGLYKKARSGEITNFTGISAPYEAPIDPEITLDTTKNSVEECVEIVFDYIVDNQLFHRDKYAAGGGI